jgi:hypothetical protein
MAISPLHKLTCVLSTMQGATEDITRFIFVSNVVDLTWNIELGCQGDTDRWWRGSTPLVRTNLLDRERNADSQHAQPDIHTQSEVVNRLTKSDARVSGWKGKGTQDKCMLKVRWPRLRASMGA